nr:argininosuccinate lyase [Kangiella sp. TOML190]
MNRLWSNSSTQSSPLEQKIHQFLAAQDIELDKDIIVYDIQASKAHANGLASIEILSSDENQQIQQCLDELLNKVIEQEFELSQEFEDCHSAIEFYLTEQLGDLGKKIHTGRSRNDQVLVATRLYCKDKLQQLVEINKAIATALLVKAGQHQFDAMPGYTHLQQAVVSSWGMWFAAFAESYIDNIDHAKKITHWIDANPLGSAAGYGVNLPLDRTLTSHELQFSRLQINPIYCQNSRGKFELEVLSSFKQSLLDARKLAWDLSLFSMAELNFIAQSDSYTTGSSIMPNKRNPDVLELIRASYAKLQAAYAELENLLSLPSGYHRDLQFSKKPLIQGVSEAFACLELLPALIEDLTIHSENSKKHISADMFMTDLSIEYAAQGIPFREAYLNIKQNDIDLSNYTPEQSLKARNSPGACADLMLEQLQQRLVAS